MLREETGVEAPQKPMQVSESQAEETIAVAKNQVEERMKKPDGLNVASVITSVENDKIVDEGKANNIQRETSLLDGNDVPESLQRSKTAPPPSTGTGTAEASKRGIQRVKSADDIKAKTVRRASVNTRLVGNLHLLEDKCTWIMAVLKLNGDIGVDAVHEFLVPRMLAIPRFRSVLKKDGSKPLYFEEIDLAHFDFNYHVRVEPEGADPADVLHRAGQLLKEDLDKPLWFFTYFPNTTDGTSQLVVQISHTITDGVAAVEVLMRVIDTPDDEEEMKRQRSALAPQPKRKSKPSFGPLNRIRIAVGGWLEAHGKYFSPSDKPSSLRPQKKEMSNDRVHAFSDKIDLSEIKAVKDKIGHGATFNDVIMYVVSKTIQQYLKTSKREEDKKILSGKQTLRTQFLISTRKPGQDAFRNNDASNQFAYLYMTMPIKEAGKMDDIQFFWTLKRKIDVLKNSPLPYVMKSSMESTMPITPDRRMNKMALEVSGKTSIMVSTVTGPSGTPFLCGKEIVDISFTVQAPIACYFGIVSLHEKVSASLAMDKACGTDPNELMCHFKPEFEKFRNQVMNASPEQLKKPRRRLDSI